MPGASGMLDSYTRADRGELRLLSRDSGQRTYPMNTSEQDSGAISTMPIYCGSCRRKTNHHVLHRASEDAGPNCDYYWASTHYFAQCAGCNAYCYAIETVTEDDWNTRTGEAESAWRVFPTPVDGRHVMENSHELPFEVACVYREVIDAINGKLSLLAAMGLRALIEAICIERNVTGNNLMERITGLASNGVLSRRDAEILHQIRFLGNSAAHEIRIAPPGEILAAFEIGESMLKSIYVVPHLANQVSMGQRRQQSDALPISE